MVLLNSSSTSSSLIFSPKLVRTAGACQQLLLVRVSSPGFYRTVSELTDTNEASHVLVKDLETAAVLLRLAGVAETTSAVEDF